MNKALHKKSILIKTGQVAGATLVSRILALIRVGLELKYFGAGPISDAFKAAFEIPNRLRKVFAEGAISAAFIPDLVKIVKEGNDNQANKLLTLMLLFIEIIVLGICFLIFFNAKKVLLFIAPGFRYKTIEMETAIPLLRILIFFIFFISSSSLLTGAMQAKHHFFIPSWGPVLLNIIYIMGLLCGLYFKLNINYLAFFIILGGFLLLILNLYSYRRIGYKFSYPNRETFGYFNKVMSKFLPSIISMSAVEINFTIDGMLASFLPAGSITLFGYASGFFRIPLGIFAVAFSTILLSHFSRISTYAPKRLSFYLLESSKFVFWVTLPVTFLMCFFSYDVFNTLAYFSKKLTLSQVNEASWALIGLLVSLFFVSINKVLLSICYSLHSTFAPTIITLISTVINTSLNLLLVSKLGIFGLAIATSIGEIGKTFFFLFYIHKNFNFTLYLANFFNFALRYIFQLLFLGSFFYLIYKLLLKLFNHLPNYYIKCFTQGIGFWICMALLSFTFFGLLYILRKVFKIKAYFLD